MNELIKKCSKCGIEKGIDQFHKDSHILNGYKSTCKECVNSKAKDTYKKLSNLIFDIDIKKVCRNCHMGKFLFEFNLRKGGKFGRTSYCSECINQQKSKIVVKTCHKCHISYPKEQFSECNKNKDGLHIWCRACVAKYSEVYNPIYYSDLEVQRHKRQYDKEYHLRPETIELSKTWPSYTVEYREEYEEGYEPRRQLLQSKRRPIINLRVQERRRTDINFKLRTTVSSRLPFAVKRGAKSGSFVRDLDCTIPELKQHLESQFYSNPVTGEMMSWKNHGNGPGTWQIDHKEAFCSFDLTDRAQFLKACHYTNLQPLWHEDHVKKTAIDIMNIKKGNKILRSK